MNNCHITLDESPINCNARISVIGAISGIASFIPVLLYRFSFICNPVCKHSLLPICCCVHVHSSSGLPTASFRSNILTNRSWLLFWVSPRVSCGRMPWFFKQSWRRTRRRTALRILLVDDKRITRVSSSPKTYRGRAGHKWQERRRQSAKREPPVA